MSISSSPTVSQGRIKLEGRELDVVCSLFSDRVFLFISEIQKTGTLVSITSSLCKAMLITYYALLNYLLMYIHTYCICNSVLVVLWCYIICSFFS